MPFKSAKKRRAYLKRWRRKHPYYSRDYMRDYNPPPKTEIKRPGRKLKYATIKELKVEFDP
jgi:hypothetical protein